MTAKWAIRAGFLLLILPIPFVLSIYGYDWVDTFYHFMHYRGWPCNMGFIVFLYPYLGRLWAELAGFSLLSFKMLDALLLVVMHVSVPFYLCRGASERSRLLMAAAGIVIASSIAFFSVGYDSFSCLVVSWVVLAAWRYLKGGGLAVVVLMGCLTALLTAIRFPGVSMVVPVVLLIASCVPLQGMGWRKAALHIVLYCVSLGLLYVLLFQAFAMQAAAASDGTGMEGMVHYIRSSLSEETTANHPLRLTLMRYLRDARRIGVNMAVLSALFLLWYAFRDRFRRSSVWDLSMLLAFGVGLFFVTRPFSDWSFPLNLLISTCGFLLGAAACLLAWRNGRPAWVQITLFMLCASFVPMAGSNTGLIKTALLLSYGAPVFCYFCLCLLHPRVRRYLIGIALVTTSFSLYYKLHEGTALLDGRMSEMTATVDDPRLAHIRTTPVRKAGIEELVAAVARYRARSEDGSVLYYGTESYIFRYLDPSPAYFRSEHTMFFGDRDDVENFRRWMDDRSRRPLVVLVFGFPESVRSLDGRDIEKRLLRNGYSLSHTGGFYKIFVPFGDKRPLDPQ